MTTWIIIGSVVAALYLLGSLAVFGRLTAISYEAEEHGVTYHTVQPERWWKNKELRPEGIKFMLRSWIEFYHLIQAWEDHHQKYLFKWSYKPLDIKYKMLNKDVEQVAQEVLKQVNMDDEW